MDHLGYVASAYGISLAIILWFGIGSAVRMASAKRKLAAVDPRGSRR